MILLLKIVLMFILNLRMNSPTLLNVGRMQSELSRNETTGQSNRGGKSKKRTGSTQTTTNQDSTPTPFADVLLKGLSSRRTQTRPPSIPPAAQNMGPRGDEQTFGDDVPTFDWNPTRGSRVGRYSMQSDDSDLDKDDRMILHLIREASERSNEVLDQLEEQLSRGL